MQSTGIYNQWRSQFATIFRHSKVYVGCRYCEVTNATLTLKGFSFFVLSCLVATLFCLNRLSCLVTGLWGREHNIGCGQRKLSWRRRRRRRWFRWGRWRRRRRRRSLWGLRRRRPWWASCCSRRLWRLHHHGPLDLQWVQEQALTWREAGVNYIRCCAYGWLQVTTLFIMYYTKGSSKGVRRENQVRTRYLLACVTQYFFRFLATNFSNPFSATQANFVANSDECSSRFRQS